MPQDISTDVAVVGAGIAGLVTAVEAAEYDSGVDVLVLEKGTRAGGTSLLSGGTFYCYETVEDLNERDPKGNRALQELVVERHEKGWRWLADHGVPMEDSTDDFDGVLPENESVVRQKSVSRTTDTQEMIDALVDSLGAAGGELMLETPMREVLTDERGDVTGVRAQDANGDPFTVRATSVVLATGGYVANERLVEENFFTENSEDVWLRASKWCTGDGVLAAEDVGAKRSKANNEFYGKSMIAPPADFTPHEYPDVTAYYGPFAVALNRRGERFADESLSIHEKSVVREAASEGYSRIYYVLDEDLVNSTIRPHKDENIRDMLEYQREVGDRVETVDSFEELATVLSEWGADGTRAVETLTTYNEAIRVGDADRLDPPRTANERAIDTPPLYVAELQPSITLTMGGLAVDTDMRVLRRCGSGSEFDHGGIEQEPTLRDPIDGLFAVGADVGNVGAITTAEAMSPMTANTVFGLVAGRNVAERGIDRHRPTV
jgi:fumarate reductase flavoprotein subunit